MGDSGRTQVAPPLGLKFEVIADGLYSNPLRLWHARLETQGTQVEGDKNNKISKSSQMRNKKNLEKKSSK